MPQFKDRRDNSIQELSEGPVTFKNLRAYAKSNAAQADLKAQGKGFIARKIGAPIMAALGDSARGNKPVTIQKKGGYNNIPEWSLAYYHGRYLQVLP